MVYFFSFSFLFFFFLSCILIYRLRLLDQKAEWLLARDRDPTLFLLVARSLSLLFPFSLSLSLSVFLSSCRCFHAEKRDRAGKNGPIESRKDGCEAITSASAPAHLARATREACRVCMRGTLIYVSFYARTRERRGTSVHPFACFTRVYARVRARRVCARVRRIASASRRWIKCKLKCSRSEAKRSEGESRFEDKIAA